MNNKIDSLMSLLDGAFYVTFNMNDTFYWASGDSCEMPISDLKTIIELYDEYGYDIIIAYEAINRGHNPTIDEVCTPSFFKAKEILLSKLSNEICPTLFRQVKEWQKEKDQFDGQLVQYRQYERTFLDKLKSFLKREKYYTVKQIAFLESGESSIGFNQYNAKDNLIKTYNKEKTNGNN